MPPQTYHIALWIDPSTHTLRVSPDTLNVERGDIVIWNVRPIDNIQYCLISTAGHPFTANLPSGNWDNIPVTVRSNVRTDYYWKYSIRYKIGTTIATVDPIIAVKPSRTTVSLIEVSLLVAVTIITLLSYFRIERISRSIKNLDKTRGL
jgi:hypothetical protein